MQEEDYEQSGAEERGRKGEGEAKWLDIDIKCRANARKSHCLRNVA